MGWQPLLERYRDVLALGDVPFLTLGEGSTPLFRAERLSKRLGLELYLKWEGANPTGSFKDRGLVVAVAKAKATGARAVVCASTGNTAASAAAYAARAGLLAYIVCPKGAVAPAKLVQARAVGAKLVEVDGDFDQAFEQAHELAAQDGYVSVNSTNPDRLAGQKTAAYEIVEALGEIDVLALPYGGGGNTSAYAQGFAELGQRPWLLPVEALERDVTFASAIRIKTPVHRETVAAAIADSGGEVVSVSDVELRAAWELLLAEGLFAEPAAAAGVAGLAKAGLPKSTRAVCIVTGHGLKDPAALNFLTHPEEA